MTFKPFDKNFIPSHTLAQQLRALIEKREKSQQQQWIDTVPSSNEATAFDDLTEIRKAEIKRDKWNRDLTEE